MDAGLESGGDSALFRSYSDPAVDSERPQEMGSRESARPRGRKAFAPCVRARSGREVELQSDRGAKPHKCGGVHGVKVENEERKIVRGASRVTT